MIKVIQIVSHLNYGDAIGDDVLAIDDTLRRSGYNSKIMSITIHDDLVDRAEQLDFSTIEADDIIIFHKSTGDGINKKIAKLPCKKIMIYHNITPARYFMPYDFMMAAILFLGRMQIKKYAASMDMIWGDSEYNCEEIVKAGVKPARVSKLPIIIDGKPVSETYDVRLDNELKNVKSTKLLFIGRIAPNKKIEDIIKVYYKYLKYDSNARLYLVGGYEGMERYFAKLKGFCYDLGITDSQVVFTGHITNEEKTAYLKNCDVFVCMSEHEGFCVPLLEAAKYRIPIVAYAAAAVPETLGDNKLLFSQKDYKKIADAISHIMKDSLFRENVLDIQNQNLERFNGDKTRKRLLNLLERVDG